MDCKLLLFDLDGTLLKSDKSISARTLSALCACRERGIRIGVCTSRSEQNSMTFLEALRPDALISSGGALVKQDGICIYKASFSAAETSAMLKTIREICGTDCEITVDTVERHYWNYKTDPKKLDQSWGDSVYTNFASFHQESLKICVEIFEAEKAVQLQSALSNCDSVRFSDGYWYKFTPKHATKEKAILKLCAAYEISPQNIIAFGDDSADIGMLSLCGLGIAMGNAIPAVKQIADLVIGTNDADGIADYLIDEFNLQI